ncbi:DUF1801 domain-containing protein [Flavimaricola marinus]|uniref:YdhG-like domain-containing protein n=1 Tax=Flavimaricola marinus TaxID=1819565 RepID=A0A238LC78_9RHOB|nr:YdeI/OmpD-associated family protein [Flavimaricola marinus]SMY07163.1 hypothetical protein LOM8899_01295 [Flavimaricola marinus]
MSEPDPKVTAQIDSAKRWRDELRALRAILLDTELSETVKWRNPCYTYDGGNVAMLYALKDCAAVSFFKGSLMSDPNGILLKPGENSQASRWMKFDEGQGVGQMEPILRAYVEEAIELQKSGAKVDFKRDEPLELVPEIQAVLAADPEFKAAFEALTRGRQRGYNLTIGGAKQSKTRTSRIEGYRDRILQGKGIHDCICGLSKRFPRCDGSHKQLKT